MEIIVNNLDELKLLVESVDLDRISSPISDADGWGTAGVIVTSKLNDKQGLFPVNSDGRSGTVLSECDKVILTPYPKHFAWFLEVLLRADFEELNPVMLFEEVPFHHLEYCISVLNKTDYDIKDELLFICDAMIKRHALITPIEKNIDYKETLFD